MTPKQEFAEILEENRDVILSQLGPLPVLFSRKDVSPDDPKYICVCIDTPEDLDNWITVLRASKEEETPRHSLKERILKFFTIH